MRTKFKVTMAALSLAILLPIGAYAASSSQDRSTGYNILSLTTDIPANRIQNVENYLQQLYGADVKIEDHTHIKGETPNYWITYPHRDDATSRAVGKEFRRILNDDSLDQSTTTPEKVVTKDGAKVTSTRICNTLFAWYFYSGDTLDACGNYQGEELDYPDLGSLNYRSSSFMTDKTAGSVELYGKTGFSDDLTYILNDRAVFGSENDKAASAIFSL